MRFHVVRRLCEKRLVKLDGLFESLELESELCPLRQMVLRKAPVQLVGAIQIAQSPESEREVLSGTGPACPVTRRDPKPLRERCERIPVVRAGGNGRTQSEELWIVRTVDE